jgi:competence protein ComFC
LTGQAGLQKRPAPGIYRMYQLIWQSLDWLFPPECGGCGRKGCRWCQDCQSSVEILGSQVCPVCGEPQKSSQTCQNCLQIPPAYKSLRSWAAFKGPLRKALHHLKYRRDLALGDSLSGALIHYFVDLKWGVDLIVPVPLGKERLKERGYNQAALLARPIALSQNIRYSSKALLRVKDIRSQVGLNITQRRQNVSGAFWANPEFVRGRSVLIVDDVTTTGATVDACAEAVKEAGATDIFAMTLARAVLGNSISDRS